MPQNTSFWTKCGKLLTNLGGSLIRCRTCPCGYYGLFVFVSWSIDGPNGNPNRCYTPGISVQPFQVIDGKIQFNGGMDTMWSGCIQINVQKDEKGRVGHVKGCGYSWDECVEWDSNDNCIRYQTVYMDCAQIDVYRIGACYSDLNDFKAFVYSKCSNLTPPYPNLWQTYYGRKYTSSQAQNCIYKDWDLSQDSWYTYAYFRYVPKANFHWTRYDNSLFIELDSQYGHDEYIGTYCWCDGNCRAYGDWGCTDCDGTLNCYDETNWVVDGNCHAIFQPAWGGSLKYQYEWPLCERANNEPQCKCIDAFTSASTAGISSINSKVDQLLSDKNQYWVGQDNVTSSGCFNKNYSSKFEPNQCWASWWIQGLNRKWTYYGKVKIEKWDNRVTYSGVKIRITAYQNDGGGDSGTSRNYPLSVNHRTTYIYNNTEMECPWGTEIEFPIANNRIGWSLANTPYCINYGSYEYPRYFPYDSGCQYSSTVQINIQIIDILQ